MLEDRIISLEEKYSFQDQLLDQLNKIVTEQQMMLEKLQREIINLQQMQAEATPAAPRSLADEVPPHY